MKPEDFKRVESVFFEVLNLPPDARPEALRRLCGDDQQLRREVESLLTHDGSTGSFLSQSALGPQVVLSQPAEVRDEPQGARVGAYVLLRRLGTGGMGTVYLAKRADGQFEQQVAIKVVKRGMDSEEILRRFSLERRTLASLNHPNIARLYDGGATQDGRPYLAMEFVDGVPIDEYCDVHRLDITQRLELFSVVCDAVRFAHQNLVVHRDIKPSNILVDQGGVPKLLDFGLAKVLGESEAADPTISQQRRLTPAYASPEQITGGTLSTATDIYSLGVVLYELLTGRRPYRVSTGSPAEFERAVLEHQPVPPSAAVHRTDGIVQTRQRTDASIETLGEIREGSPERLVRRLRGDLDTIVLKALHKEPGRRYASVEQFVADITRHLEGLPVLARPDTALYRIDRFVRRHSVAVIFSIAALSALSFGLGVAMWQREVAQTQRADAEEQREVAKKERAIAEKQREVARQERDAAYVARDTAEATADFIQRMMSEADPHNAGPTKTVKSVIDEAAIRVDGELRDQPLVQAAIRSTIGRIYLGLGVYDLAKQHIDAAYQARLKLLGPGHHDLAESEFDMARLYYELGKYDQAEALLLESLHTHEQLRGKDNIDTARVWNDLGAVRRASGKMVDAESAHLKALQIREQSKGRRSIETAESLNNLSGIVAARGDVEEAEQLMTEALSIRRELLRDEHPLVIQGIANLAVMVAKRGDYARAEPLFREAVGLSRKVLGNEHPVLAIELSSLAGVLDALKRGAEAEPLLREALAIQQQRLPADDVRVLKTRVKLATFLFSNGKHDEAAALGVQALNSRTPQQRKADGFWTELIAQLEAHYRATGRDTLAEQMLQEKLELTSPPTSKPST